MLVVTAGVVLCVASSSQAMLSHPYLSQITKLKTRPLEGLCGLAIDPVSGELVTSSVGEPTELRRFTTANVFAEQIADHHLGEEACSVAIGSDHRLFVANPGEGEAELAREERVVSEYKLSGGKYAFQERLDGSNTPEKTFESQGVAFGEVEAGEPLDVAVAPKSTQANSEDIYVSVGGEGQYVVDQFSSTGGYLKQLSIHAGAPYSVAVGLSGEVYVAVSRISGEQEGASNLAGFVVDEFNPAGELIAENDGSSVGGFGRESTFGNRAISGLAVDAGGDLYVSDSERNTVFEFDSSGQPIGTLTGAGAPGGQFSDPVGVAVNLQSGDLYVADQSQQSLNATGVIDVFAPAKVGAEAKPPFLEGEGVSSVTATSATLDAQIDPTGASTEYRFEYGPQGGPLASTPETSLGADEAIHRVSFEAAGLLANTTYEFRVVVTPSGHAVETSTAKTFTTETEGAHLTLPDGRAWELVSPPDKHGATILPIGAEGVPAALQSTPDGSRIVYSSTSPLEATVEANYNHAQALSTRGSGGWTTSEILAPGYETSGSNAFSGRGLENRIFSSDLSLSILEPFVKEPLLSPQASERAPYLHNLDDVPCQITETTCYTPLATSKGELTDVTSGAEFGGNSTGTGANEGAIVAEGATADLKHVLLSSSVPLKAGLEGGGLYAWNLTKPPAERLELLSVLPSAEGGLPATLAEQPVFGYRSGNQERTARHTISEDGRFVIWSTLVEGRYRLYLRDTLLGQTVRLGASEEAVGTGVRFQTASADGSTIFFSDEQKLTSNSTAAEGKPDLYACHPQVVSGQIECPAEDLTATEKNTGESAFLQGLVIEAAQDGSDVYFVADGVLSSNRTEHGEEAVPGQCADRPPNGATCNLYAEHDGGSGWEEPVFIATLSADDGPDWAGAGTGADQRLLPQQLGQLTARVSPDGEQLAFMSDRSLTGYDNTDASPAAGGAADEEVFHYEASSGRLVCASCNPSGQRPRGLHEPAFLEGPLVDELGTKGSGNIWPGRWIAASVPGWTTVTVESALYQSRYLSDSGRLFFDSADALVPQDKNSVEDVYEYEPAGLGSCDSGPGCVSLISSGESSDESAFLDASESGGDVFFLTSSKLLPQDVDQSYDIYDAHDCSESPCLSPPTQSTPCTSSTSCQGNSTSSTAFAAPASSTAAGAPLASGPVPKGEPRGVKQVKLSRAQQLAKALKSCRKIKKKKKRMACERAAKKKFGPKPKPKHKSKRSKKASRR